MFDFLKKTSGKEGVSVDLPPSSAPEVFEFGKETVFKDPKTGEFIYRRPISPDHQKAIQAALRRNAMAANAFVHVSRQYLAMQQKMNEEHNKILASEKEINDLVNKIRDELKLDRRWGLNIQLGVLERRDPPEG